MGDCGKLLNRGFLDRKYHFGGPPSPWYPTALRDQPTMGSIPAPDARQAGLATGGFYGRKSPRKERFELENHGKIMENMGNTKKHPL